MNFDDSIKLIGDQKLNHLKVLDPEGKKVFDLHGSTPDDLISQLQSYENILRTYGRLKFLAATEGIYKQNWKDALTWNIVFGNTPVSPSPAPLAGAVPAGYISASEAALMAQVKELTLQSAYDKRFAELEKKIEEKDNSGFEKYMPMAGLFLDLDEKKIQNMMALAGLQSAINGKGALAGPPQVQTTVEEAELIQNIQKEMEQLSQKVEVKTIYEFLKVLNEKPEFMKTLTQMAQTFKT
jgi:hypothetical protein